MWTVHYKFTQFDCSVVFVLLKFNEFPKACQLEICAGHQVMKTRTTQTEGLFSGSPCGGVV